MKKKVLIGMSGGVDSSASAAILKEKGYEVVGCTMELMEGSDSNIEDAKKVCEKLDITHHRVSYIEEFKNEVIKNFVYEYQEGKTPNPCILCNKCFKFGYLYEKARELGCAKVATGHYAKVEYSKEYKQYVLKKSKEEKKDQTYFLYMIPKEILENILFPLEDMVDKDETRSIAKKLDLDVATKKDSQEICFIPNDDYKDFLKKQLKNQIKKGKIVLSNKEVIGEHEGYVNYTIGQRKGLKIAYKHPLYVTNINAKNNEVVVGLESQLYTNQVEVENVNWHVEFNQPRMEVFAKVRYRAKEAKAVITKKESGKMLVEFEENQRAITKGQSLVAYDKNGIVLCGGIIV